MCKKLLRLGGVCLAVTAITFALVNCLPGSVAYEIAGEEAGLEDIRAIEKDLGLDRPFMVRYLKWMADIAQGDLGKSFRNQEPVAEALGTRLPVTLELLVLSQLAALGLALPWAVICACRPGSATDKAVNATAFALMSVPVFVMGLLLIYLFAFKLSWLPATGYVPLSQGLWPNLRSFALPCLCIALVEWVPLMRVLRSDLIATLDQEFILLARSKGLSPARVLFAHALRPSCLTLVTVLGIHMGHLMGGAVIVETIFALPGMGRLLISAIFSRDFSVVQGCILCITAAYVGLNILIDTLYALLDPRIHRPGRG